MASTADTTNIESSSEDYSSEENYGGLELPVGPHEPSLPERASSAREGSLNGNDLPEELPVGEYPTEIIRSTPYRYAIIIPFAVFGFINQLQYVAFSMIIRESEEYFRVGSFPINVLSLLIPIVYVIGVVPGCYLYNWVGLRYGMIIGAATNAFASLLKFIAVWAPKYGLLATAQVFVAFGQILYLSLPTLIAGIWFPPNERTLATAIASLMGFAGMAVGMFYSPHVVSLPNHNTKKEWGGLMGSQFGLSMLVLIVIGIFARDKPRYRPSNTSTEDYKLPLGRFLKNELKSLNFMLLTIAFGLAVGFPTALAGLLAQVLEPFGIEENISGVLAFSGILGGAVNCGVVGIFVDRTHYYKYTSIALVSVTTVLLIVTTIIMKTVKDQDGQAAALYVLVPLLEFLVLPIVPVVMEFAVELAYPCPETVPSTLVLASMCLFSFIGMIVFSVILGDVPTINSAFYCMLITMIVSVVSVVGLGLVREKLCRHAEDDAFDAKKAAEQNAGTHEVGGEADEEDEEVEGDMDSDEASNKMAQLNVQTGVATSPSSLDNTLS